MLFIVLSCPTLNDLNESSVRGKQLPGIILDITITIIIIIRHQQALLNTHPQEFKILNRRLTVRRL